LAVTRFVIESRGQIHDGGSFGDIGPYEFVRGTLTYCCDPSNAANSRIVDLELAELYDGMVQFDGMFEFVFPTNPVPDPKLLVDLPNRGRRLVYRSFNLADGADDPNNPPPAGDGFLFQRGYTIASIGWQFDVPRTDGLFFLNAPHARDAGADLTGQTIIEIQTNERVLSRPLSHRGHIPYPTVDLYDELATMYHRPWDGAELRVIPRDQWAFAFERDGELVPDSNHVCLAGGFNPAEIYYLVFRTNTSPIVGAGLIAARDAASFLKYDDEALRILPQRPETAYAFGVSQTARMLRHFLYLGLNEDEEQRRVYDGLFPLVGHAQKGEFNHRFGQPSVQSTPNFGHLFPFADATAKDPQTGIEDGLAKKSIERGTAPRVFYVNAAAEYWRNDCSLIHTTPDGEFDLEPTEYARVFALAGCQHSPGTVPLTRISDFSGDVGRHWFNTVDYRPILRALLDRLHKWACDNSEPPSSTVPRISDQTVAQRESVIERFAEFPGIALPDPSKLPTMQRVDLGPDSDKGIGAYPAKELETYPSWVSQIDIDGNEIAGIRLPDISVPLGTHTGWNLRDPSTGGSDIVMKMQGATHFFPISENERRNANDPRRSIESRYRGLDDFLDKVRFAAIELTREGFVLPEDVELLVRMARDRWYVAQDASPRD
jgi:hypothetical protein